MIKTPPKFLVYLTAAMMLLALPRLPYGYYQFLRIVTVIVGGWAGIAFWQSRRLWLAIPLIALAILFNPIIPFHFRRETWQTCNIAGAALLLAVAQWAIANED